MAHFYLADEVTDTSAVLVGAEARHAAQVARLRLGERIAVGDGRGRVAQGEATAVGRDRVEVRVLSVDDVPAARPRLVLVQALAKGGRDESAVQAATELGVAAVIPWQAARSVVKWSGAKAEASRSRWSTIAREAAKQAMRAWVPEVLPAVTTSELAASLGPRRSIVLEPTAVARLVDVLPREAVEELVLVVGPEGGIAAEELDLLVSAGAVPARLGRAVLRTSTAGPAALAAVAVLLDLW